MTKQNYLKVIIATFFIILFTLLGHPAIVNAATTSTPVDGNNDGIDDGVPYWSKGTVTRSDPITIGKNLQLGYSFGLTADEKSNYTPNTSDDTMVKDSTNNGSMNTSHSKMNVFLINSSNQYISSVFQGSSTVSNIVTRKEGVSLTSPDFLITKPDVYSSVYSSTMSVLGNGMSNKSYYNYKDSDGRYTYMIAGTFKRDNYDFIIELILRPSTTNRALVQREMYVRNVSGSTQQYQTFFGEDTKLGLSTQSAADAVPIQDLGDGHGIFITYGGYKLSITNETDDGFQHYVAQSRATNAPNWAENYVNGQGDERKNLAYGTHILDSTDSAYSLRWDTTTLANNAVAHYSSTIGETQSPYSMMHATKTYTNETSTNGKNNVGDKLKFTMKIINNGYGAQWYFRQLVDQIPKGLQIDASTIKKSFNGGTAVSMDSSDYDSSTRTLTVPTEQALTDNQYETVTFEANITQDAIDNLNSSGNLVNTGQFTGTDRMVAGSTEETFNADVDIPVEKPSFLFTFTKQLKNESDDNGYVNSTSGQKGDIIDYLITYTVDPNSKDSLQSGSHITDNIPEGLKLISDSVWIKGPSDTEPYNQTFTGNTIGTDINEVSPTHNTVTIAFKATVTANSVSTITNTAKITGGTTSANQPTGDMVTNGANLNVKNINGIVKTPDLIDFGSTNMFGTSKTLENTSTTGELIVAHPDSSPFNVYVSYDNDDPDTQIKNGSDDTLPTDGSGILFIKQRTNKSSDIGTWKPIFKNGTAIQTDDLQGNQDSLNLTDYVGVGAWQLKLASGTAPGAYQGTITWTMIDSDT